jgi:hypothetical protein
MPTHKVTLDDQKHRTVILNKELSSDPDFSVTVVYKMSPTGAKTNYFVIRSNGAHKLFDDVEIPSSGLKIPPTVPV